jgi:hypothetical protein
MIQPKWALPLAAWVAAASSASAAPGVLELVPEDAAAALAIRNINELRKKGDQFAADAGLQSLPRPSQLFEWLLTTEGIRPGNVDFDRSMALVLANPDLLHVRLFTDAGDPDWRAGWPRLLVLAVPVGDRQALAADFGIARGALKPDTVVEGKDKVLNHLFFYLHGNHLFYGLDADVVKSVATSPRAGNGLSAAQRRPLQRADVLLHLDCKAVAPLWVRHLAHLERELRLQAWAADDKTVPRLVNTLGAIRTMWVAARLDGGLGLSWVNTFPKKGADEARRFLASLQRGDGAADLLGLPEGRVVAAEAFRGDGPANAAVARVLVAALWEYGLQKWRWVSPADQTTHRRVFAEIWKRLRSSRVAVYHNADRARHGSLSAVAILDTDDAGQFLDDLRLLARLGGDLDLSGGDDRGDVAVVEKLVRDLGDDEFAVRESASTRLALVGEPALAYLEKALMSEDAEVRRRAKRIKETIVAVAVARRKELLEKDSLRHIHPSFGFARRPETLDGLRVDVVRMRLGPRDAAAAAALRELFGPEWDRIRLAVHGRQVVALLGSDQDLLRATLRNVREGKRGLAGAAVVAGATRHANAMRRAELHVSLAAVEALRTGADLATPAASGRPSLTSLAVTVGSDFLQLDLWLPPAEARVIEKAWVP